MEVIEAKVDVSDLGAVECGDDSLCGVKRVESRMALRKEEGRTRGVEMERGRQRRPEDPAASVSVRVC